MKIYCVAVVSVASETFFLNTHLDGSILRSCDHDREDGVEYDTRDWRAVPTQGVSLWGTGDPLLGVPLLTDSSSMCHLLFRFIQLWLQLHHLGQESEWRSRGVKGLVLDRKQFNIITPSIFRFLKVFVFFYIGEGSPGLHISLHKRTFFCNLMTEVHFFSKSPAYFLSGSSFYKWRKDRHWQRDPHSWTWMYT